MRFAIRIDPVWRPLLLTGGAVAANSYVELTDAGVHFRFGLLFDRTVPYGEINDAFPRSWPLWYGIGWRSNLRGVIGLTGSYEGVVEVRLRKRIGRWLAIFPCDRICPSLEQPQEFIAALEERAKIGPKPAPAAGAPTRRRPPRTRRASHK